VDQAKRLKGLEQENFRPKRIVADQVLDLSILKEVYFHWTQEDDGLRDLVRRANAPAWKLRRHLVGERVLSRDSACRHVRPN
jgi:hypothetical protein